MAGASMGSVGVNRVAREALNANNPFAHGPGGLPARTGRVLEVPMSFWGKVLGLGLAGSWLLLLANRRLCHTTPMTPQFQEKARKHGPVAERTDAPPVFLDPIRHGIPGGIRGPEDVAFAM